MLSSSDYWKAVLSGIVAGLIMFILIKIGIGTGMAPFNIPPSGAFLIAIGIKAGMLPALILHFLYAIFWSLLFVIVLRKKANVGFALLLSIVAWLILMLVYSPIIGWGVFGSSGSVMPENSPLYLGATGKYIIVTLILHLIYGLIMGGMNQAMVTKKLRETG